MGKIQLKVIHFSEVKSSLTIRLNMVNLLIINYENYIQFPQINAFYFAKKYFHFYCFGGWILEFLPENKASKSKISLFFPSNANN
jgi:hypothetical protein